MHVLWEAICGRDFVCMMSFADTTAQHQHQVLFGTISSTLVTFAATVVPQRRPRLRVHTVMVMLVGLLMILGQVSKRLLVTVFWLYSRPCRSACGLAAPPRQCQSHPWTPSPSWGQPGWDW